MVQLELRTKVKIDHDFYKLKFIEVDGRKIGSERFVYSGKFEKTSPLLDDLIKSDIVVSASKEIVSNENTLGLMGWDKIDLSKNRFQ